MKRWAVIGIGMALLAATPARVPLERRFELPGLGALVLRVAAEWRVETRPRGSEPTPGYVLRPAAGAPFKLMFTGMGAARPDSPPLSDEQIRGSVEQMAAELIARAVEKKAALREYRDGGGYGCFFTLTDRAPKPGEFAVVTQGMARVGPLAMLFSVFTNPGQEPLVDELLAALQNARYEPPLPAAGR